MDHGADTHAALAKPAHGIAGRRGRRPLAPGAACYNCGTVLQGHWCHVCGQAAENFHRSTVSLVGEFAEHLFDADGRLAQTLPRLLLQPASLTRDYLAGKRAPQVPPLRLFFVVLLIVFLIGEASGGHGHGISNVKLSPADRAEIMKQEFADSTPWRRTFETWMRDHALRAADNPTQFTGAMGAWAHDFAFLTLPLSGLILAVMFAFRRGFVLFDHLIFSMHSLSFQGLVFTAAMLGKLVVGDAALWLFAASPVHLYTHMRGVYGTGKFGTLVRMAALLLMSSIGFGLLMLGLVFIGLEAVSS